ncbi:MAG: 5-formyltetrahydrofolate cyclo-ligase [Clostridiales Family XIII bacterium]|jgi:5-formyltetrahydrofolate cyclo-ligase|nr:5-formyltetrahydrofolate cyclo-ligase [Clostridiales Family XIII bacterium]
MLLKKALRTELTERLQGLDDDYKEKADRAIADVLLRSRLYSEADAIFAYAGVRDEICTLSLIERALADGKRVCAPVVHGDGRMEARVIRAADDLRPGGLGLREPNASCPVCPPEDIDLALVPCISCDPFGNRLGYGGGYYDRYLKRLWMPRASARDAENAQKAKWRLGGAKKAVFAVLCRERMFSQRLPERFFDVKMDYFATEEGLFAALPSDI